MRSTTAYISTIVETSLGLNYIFRRMMIANESHCTMIQITIERASWKL